MFGAPLGIQVRRRLAVGQVDAVLARRSRWSAGAPRSAAPAGRAGGPLRGSRSRGGVDRHVAEVPSGPLPHEREADVGEVAALSRRARGDRPGRRTRTNSAKTGRCRERGRPRSRTRRGRPSRRRRQASRPPSWNSPRIFSPRHSSISGDESTPITVWPSEARGGSGGRCRTPRRGRRRPGARRGSRSTTGCSRSSSWFPAGRRTAPSSRTPPATRSASPRRRRRGRRRVEQAVDLAEARERELSVVLAGECAEQRDPLEPEEVGERVLVEDRTAHASHIGIEPDRQLAGGGCSGFRPIARPR